jgi:hypothetical protein
MDRCAQCFRNFAGDVVLDIQFVIQVVRIRPDAMTTLKRSDFGLGKYVPQVSDEVQMHIIVQAVEARPYADYLKAQKAAEAAKAKEAAQK